MGDWFARIVLWATLLFGAFLAPWLVFMEHVKVAPGAWIVCAMCVTIMALEIYWAAVE